MRSTPSVEALEKMIGAAYETLPHADERRLRAAQARFLSPASAAPSRAIWILGAFFAAGAAAWWAGETLFPAEPAVEQKNGGARNETHIQNVPDRAPIKQSEQEEKENVETGTPVDSQPKIIYRQEP